VTWLDSGHDLILANDRISIRGVRLKALGSSQTIQYMPPKRPKPPTPNRPGKGVVCREIHTGETSPTGAMISTLCLGPRRTVWRLLRSRLVGP